jgi:hypothetical protein
MTIFGEQKARRMAGLFSLLLIKGYQACQEIRVEIMGLKSEKSCRFIAFANGSGLLHSTAFGPKG